MKAVHYTVKGAQDYLASELAQVLESDAIFVCIGTDRCTGDALGPWIGTLLSMHDLGDHIVYGTIKKPVHALTIEKTIAEIKEKYNGRQVIAIDAASGVFTGYMRVKDEPILPGLGVGKTLPPVGDYSIVGTTCSKNENIMYARLDMIFDMSEVIVGAIVQAMRATENEYKESIM